MPEERHEPEYSMEFFNESTGHWDWTEWRPLTDDLDFSNYPYAVRFRYVLGVELWPS